MNVEVKNLLNKIIDKAIWWRYIKRKGKPGEIIEKLSSNERKIISELKGEDTFDVRDQTIKDLTEPETLATKIQRRS